MNPGDIKTMNLRKFVHIPTVSEKLESHLEGSEEKRKCFETKSNSLRSMVLQGTP
jgi:hypothetical protein